MEVLTAQLKAQAAQIQKVSAQLEISRPGPHASPRGGFCFASLAPK